MRLSTIIPVIAIALALSSCGERDIEKRVSSITEKIQDELSLNDEQKVKLDEVKEEIIKVAGERSGHPGKRMFEALYKQLENEDFNEKEVSKLHEEISNEMYEKHKGVFVKIVAFYKALDSEQKDKFRENISKKLSSAMKSNGPPCRRGWRR